MKLAPGRAAIPSMLVGALICTVIIVTLTALAMGLLEGTGAAATTAVAGAVVAGIFLSGILPLWFLAGQQPAILMLVAMGVYVAEFTIFGIVAWQGGDSIDVASAPVSVGAIAALVGWLAGMAIGLRNSRTTVALSYDAPVGEAPPRHTEP